MNKMTAKFKNIVFLRPVIKRWQPVALGFSLGMAFSLANSPAIAGAEFQRHYELGKDFLQRQEYKLAIQELDIASKKTATPAELAAALVDRGTAYNELKNYKAALVDFDHAITLDSKSHLAYNNRGVVYFRQGLPTQAISDFDKALSLDGDDKYALVNRAGAYLMTEHAAALAPNTEAWLKANHWKSDLATHATVLTVLAYLSGGQTAGAQSLNNEALKSLDKLLWPYQMLGFFASKMAAEKVVEAAEDSTYDLMQAQCFLGINDYIKGKAHYDQARDKFSFVLNHGTTNSVEYWLAKFFMAKVDPQAGKATLLKVQSRAQSVDASSKTLKTASPRPQTEH